MLYFIKYMLFHSNYIIHNETYYILSYIAVIAISSYESLKENFVSEKIIDSRSNETKLGQNLSSLRQKENGQCARFVRRSGGKRRYAVKVIT